MPGTGSADLAGACIVDGIARRRLIWRAPERNSPLPRQRLLLRARHPFAWNDLKSLQDSNIKADKEAGTLTITVPPPTLTTPRIDLGKSRIVAQQRGIGTRIDDFFASAPLEQRQALDQAAIQALQQAAAESGLDATARDNGREFLTGLGRQLGYPTVTVVYADEPGAQ